MAVTTTTRGRDELAGPPRSAGTGRFPHLDAMRGLAAMAVLATHVAFQTGRYATGPFDAVLARLDFGVTLFFLLSGFLLFRPWLVARVDGRARPAALGYFWRRALRILPAYWVAVVAALCLLPDNPPWSGSLWLRHLTFTQIYGSGHFAHGLTQTWSLATEVAFYLALPLLAPLLVGPAARGWRPGAILARLALLEACTIGWLVLVTREPELRFRAASTWLPGNIGWFALGMGLAVAEVHLRHRPAAETLRWHWLRRAGGSLGASWLVALGLFVIATGPLAGPRLDAPTGWEAVSKHVLYGLAALFLLLPLVLAPEDGGPARGFLTWRPVQSLGEMSYGVFLYHLVVLDLVFRWTGWQLFSGGGFLPVFVLTLAGTVVVAAVSYRLMERRVMGHKDRFGR